MQETRETIFNDIFGPPTPTEVVRANRDAVATFTIAKDWKRNGDGRIYRGELLTAETQQPDLFSAPR